MSKFVSLQSRLNDPVHLVPKPFPISTELVESVESIEQNDRVISVPKSVTIDPRQRMTGLKVTDFCLENVIAAGAVDTLRPSQLISSNLDEIESKVNFADARVAAAAVAAAEASSATESSN